MAAAALSCTLVSPVRHHPSPPRSHKTTSLRRTMMTVVRSSSGDGDGYESRSVPPAKLSDGSGEGFVGEDLAYLAKLGGGSIAGAAAIKYGSIIFPQITRPNFALALAIVSLPVILSVLLLLIVHINEEN